MMMFHRKFVALWVLLGLALSGCDWGGGSSGGSGSSSSSSSSSTVSMYTVGGPVSGLTGSLTLTNNGSDALTVTANGNFTFATALASGAPYAVTISTQPTNQTCTLANATGTIGSANITNVAVSCETFRVTQTVGASGGTVNGVDGVQVVIPAGALSADTTIGIARNTAGAPAPYLQNVEAPLTIYEITPHDTPFAKPVLVRFPVTAGTTSAYLAISSFGEEWSVQPAFLNDSYAEVERNTFSWYGFLGACVNYGSDPYPCARTSGITFVTGTPSVSTTLTSGTSAIYTSAPGTGGGSAGTWTVDPNTVTTLHFTLVFNGAPDCTSGSVTLKKLNPIVGTGSQLIATQAVTADANGDGNVTLNLTLAQLGITGNGLHSYSYGYRCTRPSYNGGNGYTTGGSDFITLNVLPGGVQGHTIGGTITGLGSASGLQLRNGARDYLTVAPNSTSFTFDTAILAGLPYNVAIRKQPTGAACTVQNGNGTVTANVTNIAVTCTPTTPSTGGLAFVANASGNTVSIFRRGISGGSLTALGTTSAGSYPYSIVVTPNSQYAYVSSLTGNGVLAYSIDRTAGTLTSIQGGSRATTNPYGLAMDPLGRFVYAANYSAHTVSSFPINSSTGALLQGTTVAAPVYPNALFPHAVAAHPSGNYVYVVYQRGGSTGTESAVVTFGVNNATGALTHIDTLVLSASSASSITVTPNGNFAYVLSSSSISRLSINPTTGGLTFLGSTLLTGTQSSGSAHSMALHPNNGLLFVNNDSAVHSYTINGTTGALTEIAGSPLSTGSGTYALSLDATGNYLYLVNVIQNTLRTFSVDSSSGGLTFESSVPTGNAPQSVATIP